jgi:ComEC/Rec2-related protein
MALFILIFSLTLMWLIIVGWVSLWVFWLIVVSVSIIWRRIWKEVLLGFVLGIIAWGGYLYRYQEPQQTDSIITISGIVTTQTKPTALELTDDTWKQRYISHKSSFKIWDRIKATGYIVPAKQFHDPQISIKQRIIGSPMTASFDYAGRLAMKGYAGGVNAYRSEKVDSCISCLTRYQRLSLRVIDQVRRWRWDSDRAGLLLGLMTGHRGMISKEVNDAFIRSGLVHLIAVSGGNLAIIASLVALVFFWLPLYLRMMVTGFALAGYAILCGMDSSVFRALVMAVLSLIAIFAGRPTTSRRLIGLAYIIMLMINPLYLVYDLWFQLSFMAVVGITMMTNRYQSRIVEYSKSTTSGRSRRITQALGLHTLVSLGAFLFTLPMIILAIWRINITWLLSNIIIVPFIPILQIWWAIASVTNTWRNLTHIFAMQLQLLIDLAVWTERYAILILVESIRSKYLLLILWLIAIGVIFGFRKKENT